jgi:hypothetical protein
MEETRTSEMLVNFYQTAWCYNPEDSHLHTHRRENLKSYLAKVQFVELCTLLSMNSGSIQIPNNITEILIQFIKFMHYLSIFIHLAILVSAPDFYRIQNKAT